MRNVATNVQEEVMQGSGHWLMEEKPAYTVALIRKFLDGPVAAHHARNVSGDSNEERLNHAEYNVPHLRLASHLIPQHPIQIERGAD
jgi:hypothetical protein